VTALAAAIGRYLHDGARLADHGRAARTRALEKFSISTMVERYLSMYEGLLRSRSQAVPRMV
jgi:glycosyltransferase involved in cell wall biosynthesis